jgi:hypothetical protein
MTLIEFKSSLENKFSSFSDPLLNALWQDGKGNWERAHEIAQDVLSSDGSWVHAYLHRKEGDLSNAAYWYSKAKRKMPAVSLADEWERIVAELLMKKESLDHPR